MLADQEMPTMAQSRESREKKKAYNGKNMLGKGIAQLAFPNWHYVEENTQESFGICGLNSMWSIWIVPLCDLPVHLPTDRRLGVAAAAGGTHLAAAVCADARSTRESAS
jgi:hypothetical protein